MIGVIGATGSTGRALVAALKEKGADFRCLVRDTAAAAEKPKRRGRSFVLT